MGKNAARIRAGIEAMVWRPYELISGVVISVDTTAFTIDVQPSDGSKPIQGVLLNAISGDDKGALLIPEENSNVIVGSIDGPGEWFLIRASQLTKAVITIGNVVFEMDADQIDIKNGQSLFHISDSIFKLTTSNESLFQLLKDCFTYLTVLTVPTPSGTSSVPTNASDFNNLISRLNNLLNA